MSCYISAVELFHVHVGSLFSVMATFFHPPSISSSTTLKKSLYLFPNPNPPISFPIHRPQTLTISKNAKPLPPQSVEVATSSQPQTLKFRLKSGESLYGIFLSSFSPTIAEIAGLAGYDFVVVDMEHGYGGISDALSCLRALAATNTAAVLRLLESSAMWAKKALDIGPHGHGIMFPKIDNPILAREVVSYCRFPPNCVRGSAHTSVRASGYGVNEGYLSNYEEELLIMCQVESKEAVKKIDEISAVEGVDYIQMGPFDLSASMGYLRDPGNKKVIKVLQEAEEAVLNGGRAYLSGFVNPHEGAEEWWRRGYHMAVSSSDGGLFRSAAVKDVKKFKTSLVEQGYDKENDDISRG